MSSSKNLEYQKTSFLSKSNSAFIEEMYLKFINKDTDLPESWKKYFSQIGEELDIVAKQINGGWLLQTERAPRIDPGLARSVTSNEPNEDEMAAMKFGMVVCEQVKSNSVIFVKGTKTVGIGPGQTSRVEAVRIAARRAGEEAKGAVMVSDAFFPFRDGIDAANEIGIASIVQPGGSIRDQEVIDAANEHNMSMLFTGVRLFRH